MSVAELIAVIELRFKSGNSVPVERIAIKRDEWEAIKAALKGENA